MNKDMTLVVELNNAKVLNDRQFSVFYDESKTGIKLDAVFMRVDSQRGIRWMFIVKNKDFPGRKDEYSKVVGLAYNGMLPKLKEKFKFKKQEVLIDHISNIQF